MVVSEDKKQLFAADQNAQRWVLAINGKKQGMFRQERTNNDGRVL